MTTLCPPPFHVPLRRIVDSVIEVLDRRQAPKANEQNLGIHLLHVKAIMEVRGAHTS